MKKRGLRNKKLLNSRKSKIVFSLIVLMFGVVIVLGVVEVYDEINIKKQVVLSSPKEAMRSDAYSDSRIIERENDIYYERFFTDVMLTNPLSKNEENLEYSDWTDFKENPLVSEEKLSLDYDGWIVEFKEESLAVKNKELENSNIASADKKVRLTEQKNKITLQRENFKNKIKQVSPKTRIRREFNNDFLFKNQLEPAIKEIYAK